MEMSPYVRFAMHHIFLENLYIERSIWDHEIVFIESGTMKFTINNKEYIVKENDCMIIPPNCYHKIEWNGENCSQPHVHFDFNYLPDREKFGVSFQTKEEMTEEQLTYFRDDFFKLNNIKMQNVIHLKNPVEVKNLIYEIINEFTFNHAYRDIVLQGLMTELIGLILRENETLADQNDKSSQLNNVAIYMNESVDLNLSLEDFAKKFHISKFTLIHNFTKFFNCSPMKYYDKLRYIRAKNLVLFSFLPIYEISYMMSFAEPQTFSRWFKKMDGKSPNFYRITKNNSA